MVEARVLRFRCTLKEQQMVEISGALHYGVSHNHIVVLGRKTPDIIIINENISYRKTTHTNKQVTAHLRGQHFCTLAGARFFEYDVAMEI